MGARPGLLAGRMAVWAQGLSMESDQTWLQFEFQDATSSACRERKQDPAATQPIVQSLLRLSYLPYEILHNEP
jgi:hypothetical protein